MNKENEILNTSGAGARPVLCAVTQKRRPGGDNGKRKPVIDEDGNKWCNCTRPTLFSNYGIGPGVAHCHKCGCNWYN
jgi:hypothetical protein